MKEFYEHYWKTRGHSGNRPRYAIFLSWLTDNIKLLDVGCGDGYFLQAVKSKLNNVEELGLDISAQAIEFCRGRNLNARLFNASDPWDFADKSFDYVVISEVLEHLVNTEEALAEAKRIARKGVLVSIPNIALYKHRLRLMFGGRFPKQWAVAPEEHLRYFSLTDFKETLTKLGFTIAEVKAGSGTRILRNIWPNLFANQICFKLIP
ncbi:MAG: methionine biosynthesis protein MetW [Candidatus Komeilibacteria bacterium]|nr:methionine biosynthesis protein MetW [Candidatus Komeilibacteria bacterium]